MTETVNPPTSPATPPADDAPVLALDAVSVDVRIDRSWIRVVDEVTLDVRPGETVGLVGESGSGKTLTSLAVMGLLPANGRLGTGVVTLDGAVISGRPEHELSRVRGRDIAMIFQEPRRSLNGVFTVGDQIAEVARRHLGLSRAAASKQATQMLDRVGIADAARRARQYPHEFSGGMCQRVMLAMALVCKPKLLVADEPTTALDVTVQRQVLELMAELQEEMGMGILLITHDLGVVAEVCDRVAVMYAGQVVERAPIDAFFGSARHPYSRGLLESLPERAMAGEVLGFIPGMVPAPTEFGTTCRFEPRCAHARDRCLDQPLSIQRIAPGREVRCERADELALTEATHV